MKKRGGGRDRQHSQKKKKGRQSSGRPVSCNKCKQKNVVCCVHFCACTNCDHRHPKMGFNMCRHRLEHQQAAKSNDNSTSSHESESQPIEQMVRKVLTDMFPGQATAAKTENEDQPLTTQNLRSVIADVISEQTAAAANFQPPAAQQ